MPNQILTTMTLATVVSLLVTTLAQAGSQAPPATYPQTPQPPASTAASLPTVLPGAKGSEAQTAKGPLWVGLNPAFVDLADFEASIQLDLRYATANNFVGKPLAGYLRPKCLLTREAAEALKQAQKQLRAQGQSLHLYDCYRPEKAVRDLIAWFKTPDDPQQKKKTYPHVEKKNLFQEGYISSKSGHSRGSTVDLTIEGLDMGTPFDFFDPLSHTAAHEITGEQRKNRMHLKAVMEQAGFRNLPTEWWHFTLKSEPFLEEYFDFDIR